MATGVGGTRSILVAFGFAFFIGITITTFLVKFANISHHIRLFDQSRRESFDISNPYSHVKVDDTNAVSLGEVLEFQSHRHSKEFGKLKTFATQEIIYWVNNEWVALFLISQQRLQSVGLVMIYF